MAAAGVTVPYDRLGRETAVLIHQSWPTRPGEALPNIRTGGTTYNSYGVRVRCHSDQSYVPPEKGAGGSTHISAYYQKTGTNQHRTEPGFRDTKAPAMLTEVPIPGYGTVRNSTQRLPQAGSMVLASGTTPLTRRNSVGNAARGGSSSRGSLGPPASGGAPLLAAPSPEAPPAPQAPPTGSSRRSASSGAPSWTATAAQMRQPWNFDELPMYRRGNAAYGIGHNRDMVDAAARSKAAGKSESGFLENSELIAKLTRPHP